MKALASTTQVACRLVRKNRSGEVEAIVCRGISGVVLRCFATKRACSLSHFHGNRGNGFHGGKGQPTVDDVENK